MAVNHTTTARGLVALAGSDPRLYAPGTLCVLPGRLMTWADQCRPKCPHENGSCHIARSSLLPTGPVDPIEDKEASDAE